MKKYGLNYSFLMIGFMATFTSLANVNTIDELQSVKEKIDHAIVKFEQTNRRLWSYTISRYENEEGDITSSIEQYSPQSSQQWQLKEINGQQPTKKQVKHFAKKKESQKNKNKQADKQESNIQISLRDLINSESLSVVSFDDEQIIMAFNVNWKKLGKDSIGKLQGQLTYQKKQQFINKISIHNNAEFSPMFTANITDLAVTFTFMQINGAVLAKQNKMNMKGSFAYFTEINETSLDTYSDYTYQGKQENIVK